MRYLFIDTSTHGLTISLSSESEILSISTSCRINEHSKYALTEMEKVFEEASLKPSDIDKIIVVNGPGSFTGIRIGVTIAKTYAWALEKSISPVSSLLINAFGYDGYNYYVSVIDARRDCVYAAIYDANYQTVLNEQYMSISDLNDIITSLDGTYIITGDIDINDIKSAPIKVDVLKVIKYCKDNNTVSPHSLNPNYLKRVEAEEKLMVVEK